jgi:hypothetical protein
MTKKTLKEIVEAHRKINSQKPIDSSPLIDNNDYYSELVHGDYDELESMENEKNK